jgi:hypothetical protein
MSNKKRSFAASTLAGADSVASPLPATSRVRLPVFDILQLPMEILCMVFDQRLECGRDALDQFAPTCKAAAELMREIRFARCTCLCICLSSFYYVSTKKTIAAFRRFSAPAWQRTYPAVTELTLDNKDYEKSYEAPVFKPDAKVRWVELGAFIERTLPVLFPSMRALRLELYFNAPCNAPPLCIPLQCCALYFGTPSLTQSGKHCIAVRDGGSLQTDDSRITSILSDIARLRVLSLAGSALTHPVPSRERPLRVEHLDVRVDDPTQIDCLGYHLQEMYTEHLTLRFFPPFARGADGCYNLLDHSVRAGLSALANSCGPVRSFEMFAEAEFFVRYALKVCTTEYNKYALTATDVKHDTGLFSVVITHAEKCAAAVAAATLSLPQCSDSASTV